MSEIAGTLWLDRKTAELRDLEYEYRGLPNLPLSVKSEDFGGRVEFQRMPTGAWIVQRWVIRMPILVDKGPLAARSEGVIPGGVSTRPERVQLAAIREEGGEVVETVARGERRESATEASTVRGIVFDSTRMEPLPNARVFFDGTQFSARTDASGRFAMHIVASHSSTARPVIASASVTPVICTMAAKRRPIRSMFRVSPAISAISVVAMPVTI